MKEQRITVEIDCEGRITANAEGFSGDTCLRDLERLLDGISPGTATIKRKPDSETTYLTTSRIQSLKNKS